MEGPVCSSKYIGLGMSAALTGLALGGLLLAMRGILLSPETTQSLLTFNHSNFFVCAPHPATARLHAATRACAAVTVLTNKLHLVVILKIDTSVANTYKAQSARTCTLHLHMM